MAWLQTSFTNHQLIDESKGNNFRKGYKVGSSSKDTDPDKSDSPLLHEAPFTNPINTASNVDWFGNLDSVEPKKMNILQNVASSKPGFFSTGFFDRSSGNAKLKNQSTSRKVPNKPKESKKLLQIEKDDKFEIEDEEDDSDDEWCLTHASAGYQRVKSGAD